MSEFNDLLSQGFAAMIEQAGTAITNAAGVSASCISTPIAQSRELRDAGYWPAFHCIAEMTRAAFTAIALADRHVVTLDGKTLKVIGIEDDPADPCVKVTLKEEPAAAA